MGKGIKVLLLFTFLLFIVLTVSGNEATYKTVVSNAKVSSNYPQYNSPDIELQTSYISDTLEAGKTDEYKIQVKNLDDKDITINPRLSANYPIVSPMYALGVQLRQVQDR
jgi:hypothetical protein